MTGFDTLRTQFLAETKQKISKSVGVDNQIMNAIGTLEEIDKVANRLAKRLRHWYALYDPELEHEHGDHKTFVDAILQAPQPAVNGMGGKLTDSDISTLMAQAQSLSTLYAQRDMILTYLEENMQARAPNITAVAGAMIGAKLMQIAGGLRKLAMMPAGTIQLLGAETALFRHLLNRRKLPPKHGVIFNHQVMQRAPRNKHGKIARVLADTLAIAAKVDFFEGEFIGDTLRKKVEDVV